MVNLPIAYSDKPVTPFKTINPDAAAYLPQSRQAAGE